MPLIKVLGRKARPVMKEIRWNISLHPSHWPFLWLLESHVLAGSFQKVAHDAARLGKRRVAQEPWVSWCHFFVGCVAWFIVSLAPLCKGSSKQLGRERRKCRSSQCSLQRDLCWERSPETQLFLWEGDLKALVTWGWGKLQNSLFSVTRMLLPAGWKPGSSAEMVFCSPAS